MKSKIQKALPIKEGGDLIPSDNSQRKHLFELITHEVKLQDAAIEQFKKDTIARAISAGNWLTELKLLCRDGRRANKSEMTKPLWTSFFAQEDKRQEGVHLPLSHSMAHRLIEIARIVGNISHEKQNRLPADWNSLYELATLRTSDRITALIDSGELRPDMDRSEVRGLVEAADHNGGGESESSGDADFEPAPAADQGRLDQLDPKLVTCPHCQQTFDARDQLAS